MQPEELAQQSVMDLAGMVILTAIPVVAFTLWCDYVERFFKASLEEREELNRPQELYRLRSAGFFVQLFQILVFFGTTPIRREYPLVAYPLFLIAVLTQLGIQKNLEGKIRSLGLPPKQQSSPESSPFVQTFRTFFWSIAAGFLYVAVMVFSVFTFSLIGVLAGASAPVKISMLVIGMGAGIAGGLCLNFALGAFFVRKVMNARTVQEGELRKTLTDLFSATQTPVPSFWIVEVPSFHVGSAMMAGFPTGRGWFRPGFFISDELVTNLSEDEFKSVILHEISHWKLQHLRKRFVFSSGLVTCASIAAGAAILVCRASALSQQAQGIVGCIAMMIAFAFSFRMLARQVKFQELAADIHAIEKLGATLAGLSSALRKLDQMHDELPLKKDPGSMMLSLGHPATEYRIRVLEKYFAAQAIAREKSSLDSEENKRAA